MTSKSQSCRGFRARGTRTSFNFWTQWVGFGSTDGETTQFGPLPLPFFLDPDLLMRMQVPYGHQNTCRCGGERPEEVCVRASTSDWWRCIHRSEVSSLPPGTIVASGEVETVKEEILFGGE
ncbi:unnamed protein product [Durusdinium trenchii]|uniref:Uncharacterized protein n=1 Tax=Durusdinium trenchii TaxID=1381693 RepID=A0ABP0IMC2_9DINO